MIQELSRFITIVDEGSFSKASQKLFITQPALSLSLERLEKVLQIKLIKRNTKHMTITSDGMAVYTMSKKIITLWESLKKNNQHNLQQTLLSVGMFDNAALRTASFFSKTTDDKFTFDITIDNSTKLQQYVKQGILDVCICVVNPTNEKLPEAILIAKTEEELLPVSNKKWQDHIEKIPFILYNNGSVTREHINHSFKSHSINPLIVAQSTSISFMKELALLGKGVALLPKNFVSYELKNKDLIIQKLPVSWKRTIGMYIPKGGTLEKDAKVLQDLWSALIK